MSTIDANGSLHDTQGRYAEQSKPAAGYDLAASGVSFGADNVFVPEIQADAVPVVEDCEGETGKAPGDTLFVERGGPDFPAPVPVPTFEEAVERVRLIRHPWEGPRVELRAGAFGSYDDMVAAEAAMRQALGESTLPLDQLDGAVIWISPTPLPRGEAHRGGEYDPEADKIRVHPSMSGNQFVILHELGHRHSALTNGEPAYTTPAERAVEERYADLFAERYSTRGGAAEWRLAVSGSASLAT